MKPVVVRLSLRTSSPRAEQDRERRAIAGDRGDRLDEDTTQTFSPSGATEYIMDGKPSPGRWWGATWLHFCSWPSGSGSAFWDVLLDDSTAPSRLIRVGGSGTRIVNEVIEKEANQ